MEETMDRALETVKTILQENNWVKDEGGEFTYEVFPGSYDDTILGRDTLKKIMESDDPKAEFSDYLYEMADEYKYSYGIPFLMAEIQEGFQRKGMPEEFEENEDEIKQFLVDNVYFYYDEKDFNQDLNVTIDLDTGDLNYDFTKCNILNYYSRFENGEIPEESPVLWLCRQMGEEDGLQEIVSYYQAVRKDIPRPEVSPFIQSVEDELLNGGSHMLQMIFLLRLRLQDYLTLKDAVTKEKPLDMSYNVSDRTGNGSVTISRKTTCGLMDYFGGGGSLLGIELPKDLEIPISLINDCSIDEVGRKYGVQDVYDLTGEPWKSGEILNIRPHTDHTLYFDALDGSMKEGRAEDIIPKAKELSKNGIIKVYDKTDGNKEHSTFVNGREYTYEYDPAAGRRAEEKHRKTKSL